MFGWFRKHSILELDRPLSDESIRRLARIVVVDDEPDSFPVEDLRSAGYTVDYWPILDAPRLSRLERAEFDLIVLDIQGIVPPGFSDTGNGLGVLRRLKQINEVQAVVACSGQSYRVDEAEFFTLADAVLAKPISSIRALATVQDLLVERMSVSNYWNGLSRSLVEAGVSRSRLVDLEDKIVRSVKKNGTVSIADVEGAVGRIDSAATAVSLAYKLAEIARSAMVG